MAVLTCKGLVWCDSCSKRAGMQHILRSHAVHLVISKSLLDCRCTHQNILTSAYTYPSTGSKTKLIASDSDVVGSKLPLPVDTKSHNQ